jgi:1-aminocyclopropane-1-carboxylate deaminase
VNYFSHPGKQINVSVLRADKIHPVISGNKWFKLRYYLESALNAGKRSIVTFGGAWSNHIAATAALCRQEGLQSMGIIRGEEPKMYSSTLNNALECGMKLFFTDRESYRAKKIPQQINSDDAIIIPEGGFGSAGAAGAATMLNYCDREKYTDICCAVGTGTMLAGLAAAAKRGTRITGISVLKNNLQAAASTQSLCNTECNPFTILHDFHEGGYAKKTERLVSFMNSLYEATQIPTDFVYTGKLFFAVQQLIDQDYFSPGSSVLLIHSGGLQGNVSLGKGTLIF